MLRRNSIRRKSYRKCDISRPQQFEHRVHAEHDPATGDIRGLPLQWQAFLGPDFIRGSKTQRPQPVVDPSCITPADISRMKRIVGNDGGINIPTAQPELHTLNGGHGYGVATRQQMSNEEFFTSLRSVVSPGDPRSRLRNFVKIAEGSTGNVFTALMASKTHGDTKVVVKCMNVWRQQRRELLFNEVLVMREGRRHPNLVDLYASYLVADELWVLMEWMDGGSLTQIVTRRRMSEAQIATVTQQCLHGLAYLHSRGIIHRDIKSDSLLMRVEGRVKISDLGFCGHLTLEYPRRRSLLGTPYWFSPTVASRQPYGTEADIWSLGITVIEMVFGEPPYFDDPPSLAMQKIVEMPAPRFPAAANVSRALDSFVSLMLAKEPERAANAIQLLQHVFMTKAGPFSCLAPLIAECSSH